MEEFAAWNTAYVSLYENNYENILQNFWIAQIQIISLLGHTPKAENNLGISDQQQYLKMPLIETRA